MIFIRADGNSHIGMGHIMRCLSIADALASQGVKPVFLTSARECLPIIAERGFEAELLHEDKSNDDREESLMQEVPEMLDILKKSKAVVLVDSYRASREYLQELGKYAKVAYIEDLGQVYPVDLLINYNIYGPRYSESYAKEAQRCLLGPAYMPLREEFLKRSDIKVAEKVRNVMITTGGTDPYLAAKAFVEAFVSDEVLGREDIHFHIVSGPFNRRAPELKETFRDNEKVVIYENVKSMRELMSSCDVVLTASGSTIYEVSFLGVPMLTFYFAENQRRGAEELEETIGVVNCGDFSKAAQECVEKAAAELRRLVQDRNIRMERSSREKLLVDGRGAMRIAEELMRLDKTVQE